MKGLTIIRHVHARFALLSTALALLSGCATGSSLSISQAPLSFVLTDDGAYEIAAAQDGTAQALAEAGTIQTGVPGYAMLGGNALLPVSAVRPTPTLAAVSNAATLGASEAALTVAPGQVALNANLAGQIKTSLAANLPALSATNSLALTGPGTAITTQAGATLAPIATIATPATTALAPVTAALAPVTSAAAPLTSGTLTTAVTLPAPTAVATPATTLTNPSLTTVASVLGSVVPPSAASVRAPSNPVLATIAAALGRRCC
ncbi:hypothetical protein ACSBM8_16295 [Sphingomonas sp. ASY06-1R]|uniref:hypothetical protein n=1 Tax=Sphingomonas sp. ASY06-1R TaxID=3445771 RepID=UPI003FA213CC